MRKFKIVIFRTYVRIKRVMKIDEIFDSESSDLRISEDDENESIINIGLPGVHKKDISISIKDDILQLRINSKRFYTEMGYNKYWTVETFVSYINLGGDQKYNTDKMFSSYENGLLTIKLKKVKEVAKINKKITL